MKKIKAPRTEALALFFRQFATLVSAHLPLTQCCQLLQPSQQSIALKKLIQTILHHIDAGQPLYLAFKQYPAWLTSTIWQLIRAGEASGTLEKTLKQIAALYEAKALLIRQCRDALFYPLLILVMTAAVCLFMLLVIVPKFEEFFQTFHHPLPLITRFIVHISSFIRNQYGLLIIPLACMMLLKRRRLSYYSFLIKALLKIKIIQRMTQPFYLLHITRNLLILYDAGMTLANALLLIADATNEPRYHRALLHLTEKITSGQSLHMAMSHSPLFDPVSIQMIKMGEESGTLSTMLAILAHLYENEINRFIHRFNQLLEPLIMVILGVLIGGLVVAMYLPIFNLGMAF